MPLIKLDLIEGRDPEQLNRLLDEFHKVFVEVFAIPEEDRFQIVTQHPSNELVAGNAGLGFERSGNLVMMQVFTQAGRTNEVKQELYQKLATAMTKVSEDPSDLFIGYFENGPSDWSFGFGKAQYLNGELRPHI